MDVNISELISAIGVIIAAYFSYNQYTRNKMTDLKVDQFKINEEKKSLNRSQNSAKVFGEIWRVLYEMKADRVYILQPHPLGHPAFISIQFEVKKKGIESIVDQVQKLPMSEVASFSKMMADNTFMYITNIDSEIDDLVIKSLLSSNGCEGVIIRQLKTSVDWVGSVVCEFTNSINITENEARTILQELAVNIQFILPEIK